jgi:hypothetical protein
MQQTAVIAATLRVGFPIRCHLHAHIGAVNTENGRLNNATNPQATPIILKATYES